MELGLSLSLAGQRQIPMSARVKAALKRYDAHLYLPGPGGVTVQSFQPGNYVESTGVTPGSVDGLVGLVLDAANGALGENIVAGGDMSSTSGWTVSGTGASLTSDGSVGTLTAGSTTSYFQRNVGTVVDRLYRVTVALPASIGSGAGRVRISGTTLSPDLVAGENVRYFAATSTTTAIGVTATGAAGTTVRVDDISVREVSGIHAYQVTQGYKPYLRRNATTGKYYWQFDGADDRLVLGSVPFQMSDDHFVIVGARSDSSSAIRMLFSNSGADLSRAAQIYLNSTNGNPTVVWRDGAGAASVTMAEPLDRTGQSIVVAARKTSSGMRFDVATKTGSYTATNGAVSFGTTTLTASALGFSQAAGQYPHQGAIYPAIIGKGAISDADFELLKKWIAGLTL